MFDARKVMRFAYDLVEEVSRAIMNGDYHAFIDVRAEKEIDPHKKVIVWGEENGDDDRFFAVSVYDMDAEQQILEMFTDECGNDELVNTIISALERYERMESNA